MGAMVLTHINQFTRFLHTLKSSFYHGLWFTHKSDHRAVGCFTGIYIQQFHTFYLLNNICNLADNALIASFTEIRYAFNNRLRLNHTTESWFLHVHDFKLIRRAIYVV